MALNIKNREVEELAAEVARIANESKTEAIRRALLDRRARLKLQRNQRPRYDRMLTVLRNEVWPLLPPDQLGKPIPKEEQEAILGA